MPRPRAVLAFSLVALFASSSRARAEAAPPAPSGAGNEAPAPRAMSLPDMIAYARAHQPAMRVALARVAARRADADVPRAAWLPTVGVSAQLLGGTANNTTGMYVSPGVFDVPRIGGTRVTATGPLRPYASTFVGAGANQELFDFGRIAAQASAADAFADVEQARASAVGLDVTFDVEEAYFAVLAAKSIVSASNDAYDRARVHRDLAKAGVDSGMRPPIELTRAEADLTRFDIGRIRARGGLVEAQTTLAATVGVDDAGLDAAGAPSAPPDVPAIARAIEQASARDPRILEVIARLHAEEERTRAIGAELRPDLSLTGTLSGRAGGAPPSGNGSAADYDGFVPYVANWDVGIVFTWPLFDGVVNARKDASRAEEDVRREEISAARHDLAANVRLAFAKVEVARNALPGLEHAVEAARANYAQADARFRAGLGTSVELSDAEALRTEAEIQLALGTFELARARAELGRAIAEGT